jgi:hypothetical protein
VPVAGDAALQIAREILINQRRQQQLSNAFAEIVQKGQATVKYSEAFKPKAAPAAKKAAPAE